MKRFFCKICRKVKRVRKFPPNVQTPSATSPKERIGECNYHFAQKRRAS